MSPINPTKKRLLFCNTGMLDFPNGAFRRSYSLAAELATQGMEVTFLTTLPVRRERMGLQVSERRTFPYYRARRDGMNVIAVHGMMPMKIRKFGYDPLAVLLRWMFAVWYRFDIVHGDGHRPAVVIPAMTQRWLYGALYVSEWWDLYGKGGFFDTKRRAWKWTVGRLDNVLESLVVGAADRLIVVSEELRRRAEQLRDGRSYRGLSLQGVKKRGDILKLWGASDVRGIDYEPDSLKHRSEFGLPMNTVILMWSGMSSRELLASRPLFEMMEVLNREGGNGDSGAPSVIFVNIDSGQRNILQGDFGRDRVANGVIGEVASGVTDWRTPYTQNGVFRTIPCVHYSEYGRLLSCADLFVMIQDDTLKNRSRWPNCVGDFMAAGRPIIGNAIGEIELFFREFPHTSIVDLEKFGQWLEFYDTPYRKMDFLEEFRAWVFRTMANSKLGKSDLVKVESSESPEYPEGNELFHLRDRIRASSVEYFSWRVRVRDLIFLYKPLI